MTNRHATAVLIAFYQKKYCFPVALQRPVCQRHAVFLSGREGFGMGVLARQACRCWRHGGYATAHFGFEKTLAFRLAKNTISLSRFFFRSGADNLPLFIVTYKSNKGRDAC
ncbi:hypothetical protein [Pseudomonas sp. NPDC007930]|uniref:hypothetical protein n=1 Tax=Pseudomonas sp. NPDC007930 TaxID=3364417 RepID=UPI0036E3871D